jgi:4-amino-4-deoxy-L-arabinose transferase-like glycosyltransferase
MARKHQKHMPVETGYARTGGTWTTSKIWVAVAIGLFILSRAYILFYFRPMISDVGMYFEYAVRAVDLHQTPYAEIKVGEEAQHPDEFVVPYPPLSYWTTLVPRVLDDRRVTSGRDPQLGALYFGYDRGFRGLMFLCDLASFTVLLLIARKRREQMAGWAALFYVITTSILGHLLYDRLDVALLMFLIVGLYCWTRSLNLSAFSPFGKGAGGEGESYLSIAWATLAYTIFGLGISFKIIPLLCLPFFLLADFHTPRRYVRLALAFIVLTLTISVPFLIQWSATGPSVFGIFKFHAEREIHLESLYSSLMSIASAFGATVFVSQSHGAFNLSGDFAGAMKILSSILLLGFLASQGLWALLRWARYTRQDAYRIACYVIPGSVILSNVLSPQYFIWAFPLLLLLALEIFPEGQVRPLVLAGLLIVVAAMTTWVFPYHFVDNLSNPYALIPKDVYNLKLKLPPNAPAAVVLGLRNFIYLAVVIWMGVMLYKRIDVMQDFSKSE